MRLEDLDEYEGLTADMVRAWLRAKGWTASEQRSLAQWWTAPDTVPHQVGGVWLANDDNPDQWQLMDGPLRVIARAHAITLQSLLREINPRMRAGWPSEEEIAAHDQRGGLWICDHGRGPCFGRFAEGERFEGGTLEMSRDALERLGAKFWPCDQHGNKVRRGA